MHRYHLSLLLYLLESLTATALNLPQIISLDNTTYPIRLLPPTFRRPHPLTTDYPPPKCHRITYPPDIQGLSPTNCDQVLPQICEQLTRPRHPFDQIKRDKYIWTFLPGCAMGFYVPHSIRAQDLPSDKGECEERLFGGIVEECARNSRWNGGSINVGEWPDWSGDGSSGVGGEGKVRFVMAPEVVGLW